MKKTDFYKGLGVSSDKKDVHNAIQHLDKGIFPGAFCKIVQDPSDPDYCMIFHADGSGTKSSLAYAYWKEIGDVSVMRNAPQDCVVMNLDDMLCVGATGPFYFSQSIDRNGFNIPGSIVSEMIQGTEEYFQKLRTLGVEIYSAGGETADMGDVVRTLTINGSIYARMRKEDVIDCSRIASGNIIVGLASFGTATYENEYNSGIGSNGITAARHALFAHYLAEKYSELYAQGNLAPSKVFQGKWRLDEKVLIDEVYYPMGKLMLSPTRTYAPVVMDFLQKVDRSKITGIIHCSGGGQTKVLKSLTTNTRIIKDDLFEIPPMFRYLQDSNKMDDHEMHKNFNMGHRMEVYCEDEETAAQIIESSEKFNIAGKIVGHCDKSNSGKQSLEIQRKGKPTLVYNKS